jgi:hypothetical protein
MILTPSDYINWCRLYAASLIALCDLTSFYMESGE